MNLSGPQSKRDNTWVRKPAELAGDREDLVIDRNVEMQVSVSKRSLILIGEIVRLFCILGL